MGKLLWKDSDHLRVGRTGILRAMSLGHSSQGRHGVSGERWIGKRRSITSARIESQVHSKMYDFKSFEIGSCMYVVVEYELSRIS